MLANMPRTRVVHISDTLVCSRMFTVCITFAFIIFLFSYSSFTFLFSIWGSFTFSLSLSRCFILVSSYILCCTQHVGCGNIICSLVVASRILFWVRPFCRGAPFALYGLAGSFAGIFACLMSRILTSDPVCLVVRVLLSLLGFGSCTPAGALAVSCYNGLSHIPKYFLFGYEGEEEGSRSRTPLRHCMRTVCHARRCTLPLLYQAHITRSAFGLTLMHSREYHSTVTACGKCGGTSLLSS